MTTWERTTLDAVLIEGGGSIKTGPFGTVLKANEYSEAGVPVISVGEVAYGQLRLRADTPRVSQEVTSRLPEYVLRQGDIVFGRKGAVDRSAWVKPSQNGWFLGSDGIRLRLPDSVSSRFISYQLQTTATREWLLQHASGSTMLSLNQGTLGRVPVVLPPLPEQRAIAEVLGALDDKIAANSRLANQSFHLAESVFASVLSRADAYANLSELAITALGGTPSRDVSEYWMGGTVPWLNSGKANEDRIVSPSEYITETALEKSAAKLMPAGATLIAITGATLGQVARLEIAASGNQSLVGIWSEDPTMTDWLHFAVRAQIPELLKRATGAAQQHVNKRDVDSLQIPIVSAAELGSFSRRASPLLELAAVADRESKVLEATRDALLPQLMSGKLRVRDAEKLVEEVA